MGLIRPSRVGQEVVMAMVNESYFGEVTSISPSVVIRWHTKQYRGRTVEFSPITESYHSIPLGVRVYGTLEEVTKDIPWEE